MKPLLFLLLSCCTLPALAQDYPFIDNFTSGSIILRDSTQKAGQIKWFPSPTVKLKFRENGQEEKYAPEDLSGFKVGDFTFVSLFNFDVYAADYALLGKTTKVKQTFGELLDTGKYNIYFISIPSYNAVSGAAQTYSNFLFEKKVGNSFQYAAYPFNIRMKGKRYEQAKEELYVFFQDYPAIIERITAYKQEDNFLDIINFMKKEN